MTKGGSAIKNTTKDAQQAFQDFCITWFTRRDTAGTAAFLDEDVEFVGTALAEGALGRAAMTAYITEDIAEWPDPFLLHFDTLRGRMVSDGVCSVTARMMLNSPKFSWILQISALLRFREDRWELTLLHISDPSPNQRYGEHYPSTLILETLEQQRQHLMDDALPGGMMGGYIEDKFPFYFINQRMLDYLGYDGQDDFIADVDGYITNCMHPDDQARVDEAVSAQFACGDEYVVEYRMRRKDGSFIWVHDLGRRVTAEDGRPAIISVCFDITEQYTARQWSREQYERELAYSTELAAPNLLTKALCNLTKSTVSYFRRRDNTDCCPEGTSMFLHFDGWRGNILGDQDRERLSDLFSRERLLKNFSVGKSRFQEDFRLVQSDGTILWCEAIAQSFQNPETTDIMLFVYTFDITNQRMNDALLHQTLSMGYDYLAEIDMISGQYRLVAQRSGLIIPESGDFWTEQPKWAEATVSEEQRDAVCGYLNFDCIRRNLEQAESYTFRFSSPDPNGRSRHKRCTLYYLDRPMGRVCLTQEDITDIIHTEQRQQDALATALAAANQANAAKSDFLSRMSHEIRTPMNAIIGMSAIAAQSLGDEDQLADCISKIEISSRFLLSLINDILDMSRIESGKMLLQNSKIPTEEFLGAINAICYSQAAAKGVDYECVADPALDPCYIGDATRLQQVLLNILSNAIKFTPEGGRVILSAAVWKKGRTDSEIRFIINDTGIGMSPQFIPHIFDAFAQESTGTTSVYGGTGLGLAISKNIVDMMGGHIAIHSIQGVGSEFTVDVRLGVSADAPQPVKPLPHFTTLRTLVVDDDIAVCKSAAAMLKELGVTAEWVDSGAKAVDYVRRLWAEGSAFDIILIDWKMPEMDGIETTRILRSIVGPDATIIIMTAYDWAAIEREARLAGVNLLISKPMFKSSLISALTSAIGQQMDQPPSAPREYDFTGRRILMAEDHPLNAEIASKLLVRKGFQVETAENGLRAMELFGKSAPGWFDAILMDIRMPVMDGLTAATNIRRLSNPDAAAIPIIAMTANAFDEDIEKSRQAGMNAHLSKPIDPERLYQTLYNYLPRPSPQG